MLAFDSAEWAKKKKEFPFCCLIERNEFEGAQDHNDLELEKKERGEEERGNPTIIDFRLFHWQSLKRKPTFYLSISNG